MTYLMFRPPSRHLHRHLYLSSNLLTASDPSSPQTQKINRIADELLSLTKLEKYDYSVLFTHKMGLHRYIRNVSVLNAAAGGGVGGGGATPAATEAKAKKTVFDVKLEKFDAGAKIKIIKEVRGFTDLGLKEAKDLVEKAPIVVKKGLTKEEAEAIIEKLKGLGATIVLE